MKQQDLLVISDFDKTLTKAFIDGDKVLSSFTLIRKSGFSKDYVKKASALVEKYYPIETDLSLPFEYRFSMMEQWWKEQNKILIEHKFHKRVIESIIADSKNLFRDGALEFIDYLHDNNIPLLILSAGLGDIISGILKKQGRYYDNVTVIANFYTYDKDGFVSGYVGDIIHVLNKSAKGFKTDKKDIILLGDSIGDTTMHHGLKYNNLLKIGFLNNGWMRKDFEESFDIVLSKPNKISYVKELIESFTS